MELRFSPRALGTTHVRRDRELHNNANKKENDARKRRRRWHRLLVGAKLSPEDRSAHEARGVASRTEAPPPTAKLTRMPQRSRHLKPRQPRRPTQPPSRGLRSAAAPPSNPVAHHCQLPGRSLLHGTSTSRHPTAATTSKSRGRQQGPHRTQPAPPVAEHAPPAPSAAPPHPKAAVTPRHPPPWHARTRWRCSAPHPTACEDEDAPPPPAPTELCPAVPTGGGEGGRGRGRG